MLTKMNFLMTVLLPLKLKLDLLTFGIVLPNFIFLVVTNIKTYGFHCKAHNTSVLLKAATVNITTPQYQEPTKLKIVHLLLLLKALWLPSLCPRLINPG